jgi:hypothetical protein
MHTRTHTPRATQVRSSDPARSTYTSLLGHATTRDTVLQRLQAHVPDGGPDDAAIAAFRRRDRVWKRQLPALDAQQARAVEADFVAHPRPLPQQASSPAQPWRGGRLAAEAEDAAAESAAEKAAAHRSEQAWAAGRRAGPRTRGPAAVVGSASLTAMRVIAQTVSASPVPVGKLKPRDREILRRLAQEAYPKLQSTPYSPPKPPVFGPDPKPPPPPAREPYYKSPPRRLAVAPPELQQRAPESRTFRGAWEGEPAPRARQPTVAQGATALERRKGHADPAALQAGRAVRFQLPTTSPWVPGFREAAVPAQDAAVQQARARWRAVKDAVETGRHVPQWGVTYESGP